MDQHHQPKSRPQPAPDYTKLPDDHPDPDELFLAVDVANPAPPGDEGAEAAWVVRYGAGG